MSKYVNISSDPENKLYVDAESVTTVWVDKRKNEMAFYNSENMFLHTQYKTSSSSERGWNIDPDQVIETLAMLGVGLVPLPVRWAENKTNDIVQYVAPSAVAYITVSQPGKDGLYGVILGVQGVGREESYEVSEDELSAIVTAVKSVPGKTIMEFGPEEAEARWTRPEKLYIDPTTMKSVKEDGHGGVDVVWKNVGRLDIRVPKVDANEMLATIRNENPRIALKDAFQMISEVSENNRGKSLAAKLAQANGELTGFTEAERHAYFMPENIAYIQAYQEKEKHILYVRTQKTENNPYPEPIRLAFGDKAKRDAALQVLEKTSSGQKTVAPKSAPPAP